MRCNCRDALSGIWQLCVCITDDCSILFISTASAASVLPVFVSPNQLSAAIAPLNTLALFDIQFQFVLFIFIYFGKHVI